MSDRSYVLALDSATRHPALGLVGSDDVLVAERQWESRHRHSEQLLEELDTLLAGVGGSGWDLRGVVVGIGPGSFTGLRIGLATAKTIAYALGVPLVGVSTTQALALAASKEGGRATFAVSLPAGATDRYVHRVAVDAGNAVHEETAPQLVTPGAAFEEATTGARVVAVDLDDAEDVVDQDKPRGALALRGLAAALATLGMAALREGRVDDVARVVPAYVALPRGIAKAAAEMTWSPDLR